MALWLDPVRPYLPWLFLAVSLAGAGFTLNALRPLKGGRVLLIPAFLSSWIVGEMVAHQFLWQLMATVLFVWLGALAAWPGWVALSLTAISWIALVAMWLSARRAEGVVRGALAELAPFDEWPRVPWTKLVTPLLMGRRGVKRTRGVEYARVGKKRLLLDVYEPASPGRKRPAVLQIHGGGWVLGSRRDQGLPLLYHLASHGWVGFNVDYRLSPRATFPDHLVDIKRALAWIREHADEYGVDPDFVVVTGGSAGGHLTAMMALTQNDPSYQPGFESADTRVQAAVPFYGVYCFVDRFKLHGPEFFSMLLEPLVMKAKLAKEPEKFHKASPLDQVNEDAPPFFVIHGDRDTLAPVQYARELVRLLRERSHAPVVYAELPGAQHAFDIFYSPRSVRVVEGVERFLSRTYATWQTTHDSASTSAPPQHAIE
ncbi:MAG: alpha/beta hydrolase [Polyangiaceae bacterium]